MDQRSDAVLGALPDELLGTADVAAVDDLETSLMLGVSITGVLPIKLN